MNDLQSIGDRDLVSANASLDYATDVSERAGDFDDFRPRPVGRDALSMTMQGTSDTFASETVADVRRGPQLVAKRLFDIVASAMALALLLPLFFVVAAIIKATSAGPVFFRQERVGLMGRPFRLYKFRSMTVDDCDVSGVKQTTKSDVRVTGVGRFIRRTSIDELPQLLNVLRGEMSLVGPRPHVAGMLAAGMPYEELVPYYNQRLAMLPGLTGWAQANGFRGPTDRADLAKLRVDHDIAYVQNFSLWLDVKIMAKTIQSEFLSGSGV